MFALTEIGMKQSKIEHLVLFFLPKFAPAKLHLISALQFGKRKISSADLKSIKIGVITENILKNKFGLKKEHLIIYFHFSRAIAKS